MGDFERGWLLFWSAFNLRRAFLGFCLAATVALVLIGLDLLCRWFYV